MKRALICMMIGLLGCVSNVFAQDSLGVTKIGDIGDSWYNVVDMEIREPYLFVLNWYDALVVFRLVDNDEPKFVGRSMDLLGRSFKVFGSKAVIKVDSRRLRLADLSDPATPRLTSVFNAEQGNGFADFCVFDENYLAITTWDYGLRIYDISNMSSPNLITTLQTHAFGEVDANGSILYLRSADSLYTIDASNPFEPQAIGVRHWQGNNYVQGDRLYRIDNTGSTLISYSILDPTNPVAIGDTLPIAHNWGHPGQLQKVSVSNRLLAIVSAVANNDGYNEFFDLNLYGFSESGAAFSISDTSWNGSYGEIAVGDSTIIVRHDDITVGLGYAKILKNVEGAAFEQTFIASPWGAPMRLELSRNKLVSNRAGAGWNVFDVSEPESPVWLSSGSFAREGVGYSQVLFSSIGSNWLAHYGVVETELHDFTNFQFVNIEDPLHPSAYEIDDLENPYNYTFDIHDSLILFCPIWGGWLKKGILQDDSCIVVLDSIERSFGEGAIQEVIIQDTLAIVSCDHSLNVIDLDQAGMAYLGGIGSLDRSSLSRVNGTTVYRAVYSSRWLQFFDITDPLNVSFEGQAQLASVPNGLCLSEGHVFYSNPYDGLRIERLVNFDSLEHVGHYNTNFRGEDVAVINDIAYLANSQDIFVLDVSEAIHAGVPAVPQELLLRRTFDPDHLNLTWLPVTTDELGRPITIDAYEIYRRYSSNEQWVNIGVPTPPTATQYTVDIPLGSYAFSEYYVRAVKH